MAPKIKWLDERIFEAPSSRHGRQKGRAGSGPRRGSAAERNAAFPARSRGRPAAGCGPEAGDSGMTWSAAPPLARKSRLQVEAEPGEEYLLIVKHPSGALSFHRGTDVAPTAPRRGRGKNEIQGQIRHRVSRADFTRPPIRRFGAPCSAICVQGIVDTIVVKGRRGHCRDGGRPRGSRHMASARPHARAASRHAPGSTATGGWSLSIA